jgi:exopolysaccharide production protein ExoZ
LLVVLYHTDLQLSRLSGGTHAASAAFGATGTDLLFVISGFIMVYTCRDGRIGLGEFLLRRFARIAPLYWLFTLFMLAIFLAAPALFKSTAFDAKHFLASLVFVPCQHPVLGLQQPFLVPGWSLNYFAFFYLLFGSFLFLPSIPRVAAVGGILCVLAGLRWMFPRTSTLLDFYGAPFILDYLLGMLVASVFLLRKSVSLKLIAMVAAISSAVFVAGTLRGLSAGYERFLFLGVPDAGLLFAVLFVESEFGWWNPYVVAQLGEASFAIYLSHVFALSAVSNVIGAAGLFPVLGPAVTQVLLLLSAVALGLWTNAFVERPLHRVVSRYIDLMKRGARWRRLAPARG